MQHQTYCELRSVFKKTDTFINYYGKLRKITRSETLIHMGGNQNERDVTEMLMFAIDSGNKIVALETAILLITFPSKAQPQNVSEWI